MECTAYLVQKTYNDRLNNLLIYMKLLQVKKTLILKWKGFT